MAGELDDAVVVDFPLRGEGWMAVTTPAARIPSHGTDMLGQRFAFDFLKVDERAGTRFHPAGMLRANLVGVRVQECYAWGAPIYAPCDGVVVLAVDGVAERAWIHPVTEAARLIRNAWTFTPGNLPAILGNHVILRTGDVFAAFVHLAPGSVAVRAEQIVRSGELLGRVGHTGNSTSPHLHFQLMDSLDVMTARGIPCAFRRYDVEHQGSWMSIRNGIPAQRERLRSAEVA
ncbi:M23 family metallopeptidase [Microbacterium deminutum]|uniref:M23 family metallopeptidase n=1 Tax=Microbacterium deminutum TaxID=344164 RepID=A0ABP5CQ40_9MICO